MKKSITAFVLCVCMFSCSTGPEERAKKFFEHYAKGEFEEAKKYATKRTGKALDRAGDIGDVNLFSVTEFEVVKDSIAADTAWVTLQGKDTEQTRELRLVRENGEWLVQMGPNK